MRKHGSALCFGMTVVLLAAVALAPLAQAAPLINITANPPFRSVLEGESGVFDFTVTNISLFDVTIDDVRLFANSVSLSISFISGDLNDEVWNTQLVNEARCEGKVLGPRGTCTFQQLFETRDLHPERSDTNVGIWLVENIVQYHTDTISRDFAGGAAKVEVRDPGARSTIPEPSSLLSLGSGMIGLVGTLWRRRKRAGSPSGP